MRLVIGGLLVVASLCAVAAQESGCCASMPDGPYMLTMNMTVAMPKAGSSAPVFQNIFDQFDGTSGLGYEQIDIMVSTGERVIIDKWWYPQSGQWYFASTRSDAAGCRVSLISRPTTAFNGFCLSSARYKYAGLIGVGSGQVWRFQSPPSPRMNQTFTVDPNGCVPIHRNENGLMEGVYAATGMYTDFKLSTEPRYFVLPPECHSAIEAREFTALITAPKSAVNPSTMLPLHEALFQSQRRHLLE